MGGLICVHDDEHLGDPARVRWLLIKPDGTVSVRQSDNWIIYIESHDFLLQWALRRDVGDYVDPGSGGQRFGGQRAVMITTDGLGVAVVYRDDDYPGNPIATALLRAVDIEWPVCSAAAWLGDRDPKTWLYGDIGDGQLAALRSAAAHSRT